MLVQEEYFKNIFNTVREAILVLDENMRVLSANRSFFTIFKVDAAHTINSLLYDLGNGQWNIQHLRVLLEDVLPNNDTVDDYEIEHVFESIGRKTMLLNARKIREKDNDKPIILLAIEDITERREIEAGLEKTRKELEVTRISEDEAHEFADSVINTVREPLISLDQDLRVVTVSRSFYEFFKVKPEETVGQLIYDLGNKQWDIPKLRELLETILPQKTSFDNYEVEHNFATIGKRIMRLNARQITRVFGKERIILLAIEDITERKRLENLLKDSEEQYRRLFETASDGIVLLEKSEGKITNANPATEKLLGYTEKESIGNKLQDIGVVLDKSDFPTTMQNLNKSGILNYRNVTIETRSGQHIDTEIYLVDRAKLVQCNIRDITQRKQAEEKLKLSEARLTEAQAMAKVGSWETDLSTLEVIWSEETYRIFEIDPDGFQSHPSFLEFVHPEDRVKVEAAFVGSIGKHMLNVIEHRIVTHGGLVKFIEERWHFFYDNQGIPVRAVGTCQDITDRKHAEEEKSNLEAQLRHSQKMEAVGTLAGGIAHDFNNMLNVIMGYGSMIMDNLTAESPLKEHMSEVLIAAERAAELTKRLLVFSRKQVVEMKVVDINEVIRGVQKMLSRIIRENIDLQLNLADKPLIVLADAGQIEQVLINLAANARDAMLTGGSLTISTGLRAMDKDYVESYGYGKPGKYVLITVTDTGKGIDAETLKKIFEPFFTTKGIGEGTGLGLSISYGIIKQHEGYIKVYSESGKGTVFNIYLPLSDDGAVPARPEEVADAVRGGNETILMAEDDASLSKLTRVVLESFGYTVVTAVDGEDAITKYMENRALIGLVLLDMIMPKKNGKEVAEEIRQVTPQIKILYSSGYSMEDIINRKFAETDHFDFIHKPFLPKDLLIKIREILDR